VSVTISTKVPEELAETIAEAQEEGESTSACVRRLIRGGLEREAEAAAEGSIRLSRGDAYAHFALLASLIFVAAAFADTEAWLGYVGLLVIAGLAFRTAYIRRLRAGG